MLARLDTEERCMTKEEFLYELQKETLNTLRPYLCCHLEPLKVLAWLQSKNFFSVDDCEQIQTMNTTKTKVNKLIDILIKSGPNGLIQLCKAINHCSKTQKFIAVKLSNTYKEIKLRTENQQKLHQIVNGCFPVQNSQHQDHSLPPPYSPPRSVSPSLKMQPPSFGFLHKPVAQSQYYSSDHSDIASSFHSSDFRGRCDSSLTVSESPSYIEDQVVKLQYTHQESRSSPSEDVMTSVIEEQDNQFEKYHRNAQKLVNKRFKRRSRSPNEHDAARSFPQVASLMIVKDVDSSTSDIYPLSSEDSSSCVQSLTQLNLSGFDRNSAAPSTGCSSITIFRPENNESFEVSGGDLSFGPTS